MAAATRIEPKRWYPLAAVLGVAAFLGLVMLAFGGRYLPQPAPDAPSLAFVPQAGAALPEGAADLAARLQAEVEISQLTAAGQERGFGTLAEAVTPDGARVLLDWAPETEPPVFMRETRAAEDLQLVDALRKHLPAGSTVLAMPDVSNRLEHFVEARWPLAAAAPVPLAPGGPGANEAALANLIAARAGGAVPADAPADPTAAREALFDALLAEDAQGAARLRVLAGTNEAYVLVHLHDAFALGLMRPSGLPMVRRNFTASSFSHDLAREAKAEVAQKGYAAYAIDRAPGGALRGHFLIEARDTATLIAQLLPFDTSRLGEVPGLTLVYQTGGYWLYRIAPVTNQG